MKYWPLLALGLLGCSAQEMAEGVQKSAYSAQSEVVESSWPEKPPYQLKYETVRKVDTSIDVKIDHCLETKWRLADLVFFDPEQEKKIKKDLREACTSLIINEYY